MEMRRPEARDCAGIWSVRAGFEIKLFTLSASETEL
jgi:hypothetical protein